MQRLEVSGAVRPIYGSLCVKRLKKISNAMLDLVTLVLECSKLNVRRGSEELLRWFSECKLFGNAGLNV